MVYLAWFVTIISTVGTKNKQFQHFSDIVQTFPEHFQIFYTSTRLAVMSSFKKVHTIITLLPKERKALYSVLLKYYSYYCFHIFRHSLLAFNSRFHFRHSRNKLYMRLEECICCALKEDAVYTSVRDE